MSFYDDASLIMYPSGYKEDKIYSLKPTDGSGDLTFTRASSATRVNAEGLIEEMPYNKLTYSNDFSNAAWVKERCTVTSGQSGYDGTNDAWLIQSTATAQSSRCYQTFSSNNNFNRSVYAKKGTSDYVAIYTTSSAYAYFNLSNGTIGTQSNNLNASILSVGDGWYRCSVTMSSIYQNHYIFIANSDNSTTTNSGDNIYIQDAQLNSGSTAKTYFPTTDRLNVPRIDYTGGGCGKLLLEPQRTNLVTYSESFDNAAWNKSGASVVSGKLSPSGDTNAFKLVENTANSLHFIESINIGGTGVKTFTIFVNAKEVSKIGIRDAFATGAYTSFDLATGSVITEFISNGTIAQYGNDFYRISITQPSYTGNSRYQIFLLPDSYIGGSILGGYLGDGVSGLDIYGAQVELSSYATSYIPTSGATVTRLADSASKTGISSLIGQTEGTLYCEIDFKSKIGNNIIESLVTLNNNVNNLQNIILLGIERLSGGVNRFYPLVQVANATTAYIVGGTLTDGTYKAAFAYKANDFVLYVNGVQIGVDTSGAVPTTSEVLIGKRYQSDSVVIGDGIQSAMLFKTRLSNAELATLTTL